MLRSQTVKYKSNKWKRTSIIDQEDDKEQTPGSDNEQMFVPNYGSMSSICVDNKTTCLKAIKILLEKFHIENSPENYSLYKVYQAGNIKELNGEDLPLIQRILMGPFNEDKIFIMEGGRDLSMNQDVTNLICLPEALLKGIVENSKKRNKKK